jgi:anti-sigma B factor antagonist
MPPEFTLTEQTSTGGHHIIAPRGEIDLYTAPDLKQVLTVAIEGGERRLVIDLTDVSFLDSTALGVLIGAVKRVRSRGGALAIVNTDSSIAKTFEITGLDQIFTILGTREDAMGALDRAEGDAA